MDCYLKNIPETLQEFEVWKENYEVKHMKFFKANKQVADDAFGAFDIRFPWFLKPLAKPLACTLMDDRLREALGYRMKGVPSHILLKMACLSFTFGSTRGWFIESQGILHQIFRAPTARQVIHNPSKFTISAVIWPSELVMRTRKLLMDVMCLVSCSLGWATG